MPFYFVGAASPVSKLTLKFPMEIIAFTKLRDPKTPIVIAVAKNHLH